MKTKMIVLLIAAALTVAAALEPLRAADAPGNGTGDSGAAMSETYGKRWNPAEQARIEADIRANRMAAAVLRLPSVNPGTDVTVEQLSHDFLFGANCFLFGDLKNPEKDKRYAETFGTLFNAVTVPFYWRTLEPEQGKPRYTADSPYEYRRPPTDPVVAYMESRGVNINGHAIIYGMRRWAHPTWMPEDRKAMEPLFEKHVKELAERYAGRVQRWDVVNESIDQANRGLMPDDYTFKTFVWADKYFPSTVRFNSNDNNIYAGLNMHRRYVEIVRNLIDRGARVDCVGVQMHIYSPSMTTAIANGADILTPAVNREALDCLSGTERPIHVSEVTICAGRHGDGTGHPGGNHSQSLPSLVQSPLRHGHHVVELGGRRRRPGRTLVLRTVRQGHESEAGLRRSRPAHQPPVENALDPEGRGEETGRIPRLQRPLPRELHGCLRRRANRGIPSGPRWRRAVRRIDGFGFTAACPAHCENLAFSAAPNSGVLKTLIPTRDHRHEETPVDDLPPARSSGGRGRVFSPLARAGRAEFRGHGCGGLEGHRRGRRADDRNRPHARRGRRDRPRQ